MAEACPTPANCAEIPAQLRDHLQHGLPWVLLAGRPGGAYGLATKEADLVSAFFLCLSIREMGGLKGQVWAGMGVYGPMFGFGARGDQKGQRHGPMGAEPRGRKSANAHWTARVNRHEV